MIRKALVFMLAVALANGAGAAVIWNWTGAAGDSDWNTYQLPASNWSVTGDTIYTDYPSQQYQGVGPEDPSAPPDYRYINDDVTAINITNGDTVNKTYESPYTSSDCLYLGGSNCVLTLDNVSTLNVGKDLYVGVGTGTTAAVDVLGGSTLNFVRNHIGEGGGTGVMTVDGATIFSSDSTGHNDTGEVIVGGSDGTGSTGTLELKNSSVANIGGWMRVGGHTASSAVGSLIVTDSTLDLYSTVNGFLQIARSGTGTFTATGSTVSSAREFLVGYLGDSSGEATLTGSTLSTGAYWRVASEIDSEGEVTLTGSTVTVDEYTQIGRKGTGTLTATDSTIYAAQDEAAANAYFCAGYYAEGNGTMNLNNTTVNVGIAPDGVTVVHGEGADVFCGYTGTGKMNVTNGSTVRLADDLTMGYSGGNGTLNVDASSVTVGDNIFLANNATGEVNLTHGSTVVVSTSVYVAGSGAGGNGTLNIDNSSVTALGDDVRVATKGTGVVNVTNGGSLGTDGDAFMIALGDDMDQTAVGTVTVTSGGMLHSAGRMYVGYSGGTATMNLTDAVVHCGTDFRVAHTQNVIGHLNIYGSTVVNVGRDFETCTDDGAVAFDSFGGKAYIHMVDGEMYVNGYCALGDSLQGDAILGTASYTEFVMDDGIVEIGIDPPEYDPWDFDPELPGNKLGDLILGWYNYDADASLMINGGEMTVHGAISFGSNVHWTTEDPDNPGTYLPTPHTGTGVGTLRITVDGGVLQGEDLVYTGHTPDSLLTFVEGQLRINGSALSEADIRALITAGDIAVTGTENVDYFIFTSGDYTVLSDQLAPPSIPGDTDGDGDVDGDDAAVLADHWGQSGLSGGATVGDFNGDGAVDVADAAILAGNWTGPGEATPNVPEPSTWVLLLALPWVLSLRRRR